MFRKILYPTDFSEYAGVTLSFLGELRKAGVGEILLLHVVDKYRVIGMAGSGDIEALQKSYQKEAEEGLEESKKILESQGFKARIIKPVPVGNPAEEIVSTAEREGASMIFIGSRGKGILREAFLGSVSGGVVKRSNVPVLVTKAKVLKEMGMLRYEKACKLMFRKIVYPTDFSECSERALEYVKEAIDAGVGVKEVVIMHVVEKGETKEEIEKNKREAKTELEDIKGDIQKKGVKVKIQIPAGIASREILRVAQEENASIIMIGSRGLGFIKGMLLGSTSDKVVREAEIPVFLCKRKLE